LCLPRDMHDLHLQCCVCLSDYIIVKWPKKQTTHTLQCCQHTGSSVCMTFTFPVLVTTWLLVTVTVCSRRLVRIVFRCTEQAYCWVVCSFMRFGARKGALSFFPYGNKWSYICACTVHAANKERRTLCNKVHYLKVQIHLAGHCTYDWYPFLDSAKQPQDGQYRGNSEGFHNISSVDSTTQCPSAQQ
jgi:hypothetical protein